jgi:hypothetical protein
VAAANEGEALKAIRDFVESNGVTHVEYCTAPDQWVPLGPAIGAQGQAGRGRDHFLYHMFWENFVEADGSARGASMVMCPTRAAGGPGSGGRTPQAPWCLCWRPCG